jgi:hypothetical protein
VLGSSNEKRKDNREKVDATENRKGASKELREKGTKAKITHLFRPDPSVVLFQTIP